jgi:hypothetical protein
MARPTEPPEPPSVVPTTEDWIRAAAIFEFRARPAVIQGTMHVIVTAKLDDQKPSWLRERFGGAVYAFGVQQRWQLNRTQMHEFLEGIRPYLQEDRAKDQLQSIVEVDAGLQVMKASKAKHKASTAALATHVSSQAPVKDRREYLKLWEEEFDEPMAQAAYDGVLKKGVALWFETGPAVVALYAAWFREHGCIVEEENGAKLSVMRTDDGVEREHVE